MEKNPANQLILVVYPIIYKVLHIPDGCLGFLKHQQYDWLYMMTVYQPENAQKKHWICWPRTPGRVDQ